MSHRNPPAMVLATVFILGLATISVAVAQEAEGQPEMTPEALAEMEAWMKLAQPGEHHQHLARYAGDWKTRIKMWMAPDTEPMVYESKAQAQWILGGRYLQWDHAGEFGGMIWEGRGIDAYNNGDRRYETSWIDNFGTLILNYTGECSDDGKTRELNGGFSNPVDGGTVKHRVVYTWIDDDHFRYESFMDYGQGEFQNMEMLYERQ